MHRHHDHIQRDDQRRQHIHRVDTQGRDQQGSSELRHYRGSFFTNHNRIRLDCEGVVVEEEKRGDNHVGDYYEDEEQLLVSGVGVLVVYKIACFLLILLFLYSK